MSAVRGNFTKGGFYKAGRIVPGVDNVVSAVNENKHKEMRAQMNSTVRRLARPRQIYQLTLSLVYDEGYRRI